MIDNKRVPTGPPRAQVADMIYPAPTWDERIYGPEWFANPSEVAVAVLTGIMIGISLFLMGFVVSSRLYH